MFHKNFPWGKGLWIWEIQALLSQYGTIDAACQKCKDTNISYVIIKAGDGKNTWPQFSKDLIGKFKFYGINVYAWSYVYGDDPVREAQIASWALNLGADGFVIDAESEYQGKNTQAVTMMTELRKGNPDSFVAYAPFAFIHLHKSFPYQEFGKYCDAVMPQMYWGTMGMSVQDCINQTYQDFLQWQQIVPAESVKPIIPVGQAYDNSQENYVLTPKDLTDFINGVAGYHSVNFWSMQHILRDDCWSAIKDGAVKPYSPPVSEIPPQPPKEEVKPVQQTTTPSDNTQTPIKPVEQPKEPTVTPQIPVADYSKNSTAKPQTETPPNDLKKDLKQIDYFLLFIKFLVKIFNTKLW